MFFIGMLVGLVIAGMPLMLVVFAGLYVRHNPEVIVKYITRQMMKPSNPKKPVNAHNTSRN